MNPSTAKNHGKFPAQVGCDAESLRLLNQNEMGAPTITRRRGYKELVAKMQAAVVPLASEFRQQRKSPI